MNQEHFIQRKLAAPCHLHLGHCSANDPLQDTIFPKVFLKNPYNLGGEGRIGIPFPDEVGRAMVQGGK